MDGSVPTDGVLSAEVTGLEINQHATNRQIDVNW